MSAPDREDVATLRDVLGHWPIGSGYYSTSVGIDEAADMAEEILSDPSLAPVLLRALVRHQGAAPVDPWRSDILDRALVAFQAPKMVTNGPGDPTRSHLSAALFTVAPEMEAAATVATLERATSVLRPDFPDAANRLLRDLPIPQGGRGHGCGGCAGETTHWRWCRVKVGTVAHQLGQAANTVELLADRVGSNDPVAANMMYQAGEALRVRAMAARDDWEASR